MVKQVLMSVLLFFSLLYSQSVLQNYLTTVIIDSIAQGDYSKGWYTGYYDVHLATNGTDLYLAAKKMYKSGTHSALAELVFGTREGMGRWNFEVAASYNDTVYTEPLNFILIHDVLPVVYFVDRPEDLSTNYRLMFTNSTPTGWAETLVEAEEPPAPPDYINWSDEHFQDGFNLSTDENGPTAYWWRAVLDTVLGYPNYRPNLLGKNWVDESAFKIVELPAQYIGYTRPVVTKDGEYIAFSIYRAYSDHSYWCIYVYRKSADHYVRDFADSTISDAGGYDYLNVYYLAIGKKPNGDVLLVANGNLANPIYLKSNGVWSKIMESYPYSGGENRDASNRPLNNERIYFSSDGTAFWGDLDGFSALNFSAEVSYFTPEGEFGHFAFPSPAPYSGGGIFQSHDFVITQDDTLHFVYEFQPWSGHPKCLVEGKVYVPDLLRVTSAEQQSENLPVGFELAQNYPNPFNPTTTIEYYLPTGEQVRLIVYDVSGRKVKELVSGFQTAGAHRITFDASGLTSGVYFYRLEAVNFSQTRKMILMK